MKTKITLWLLSCGLGALILCACAPSMQATGQPAVTPTQGADDHTSVDAQKITDTLYKAIRIDIEAAYSLDASKLVTVYINDPRGGELAPAALTYIQEVRQDYTIRKDQVGI